MCPSEIFLNRCPPPHMDTPPPSTHFWNFLSFFAEKALIYENFLKNVFLVHPEGKGHGVDGGGNDDSGGMVKI